jgi:hypothetical protein
MQDAIIIWLPYVLSAITAGQLWLVGNLHRQAWLIALVNQALWLGWIIASANWGFLPMNAVLWFVYYRNHLKWQERA